MQHNRRRWLMLLAVVFTIIAFLGFAYWFWIGRFQVSTDDAYVKGNTVQVMSQISGNVTKIYADETQAIEKGQKLISLDEIDAKIALNSAKAELALTARKVSEMYTNAKALRAAVDVAKDNLDKANQDMKRREGLSVNKTISAEDLEHAQIAAKSANDALALAEQRLAQALNLVGGTELKQHPQITSATIKLRDAYLNWVRTTIYAPTSGYIAKRSVQVGERVNTNSVLMVLVPLDKIWIDANFKESQLKDLRIGQGVTITSDIYGSKVKYKGIVKGLSPGTGSTFDLLPPQNATGNWIKIVQRLPVRIEINDSLIKQYPLRIGLSTTVTINTHDRSGSALTSVSSPHVIYESYSEDQKLKEADTLIEEILKSNIQTSFVIQ